LVPIKRHSAVVAFLVVAYGIHVPAAMEQNVDTSFYKNASVAVTSCLRCVSCSCPWHPCAACSTHTVQYIILLSLRSSHPTNTHVSPYKSAKHPSFNTHTHIYIHPHVHTCTCTQEHVRLMTYTNTMHTHKRTHTHIHTQAQTHTHSHTRTHALTLRAPRALSPLRPAFFWAHDRHLYAAVPLHTHHTAPLQTSRSAS
jgi:hypothetical protein